MNKYYRSAVAAVVLTIPGLATAASITPDTYSATIDVGETITVNKTVTTDAAGASKVDVLFLADTTGSMGGVITNVRNRATDILNGLGLAISDVAFGVAGYDGDPLEPADTFASAYSVYQTMTTVAADAVTAMSSWVASGGGDGPEGNFYALQQAATDGANTDGLGTTDVVGGANSGQSVNWRAGAQRILLWFGDARSHTTTVDETEALNALVNNGVTVVAFNSTIENAGIDQFDQATNIVNGTGGTLVNSFASQSGAALTTTVLDQIDLATSSFDLDLFVASGDTSGLDVSFTCTSIGGCDDVPGGESRTFDMTITGLTPGTYDFEVGVTGISGLFESDSITVRRPGVDVPEPSTFGILALGAMLLGVRRIKR